MSSERNLTPFSPQSRCVPSPQLNSSRATTATSSLYTPWRRTDSSNDGSVPSLPVPTTSATTYQQHRGQRQSSTVVVSAPQSIYKHGKAKSVPT